MWTVHSIAGFFYILFFPVFTSPVNCFCGQIACPAQRQTTIICSDSFFKPVTSLQKATLSFVSYCPRKSTIPIKESFVNVINFFTESSNKGVNWCTMAALTSKLFVLRVSWEVRGYSQFLVLAFWFCFSPWEGLVLAPIQLGANSLRHTTLQSSDVRSFLSAGEAKKLDNEDLNTTPIARQSGKRYFQKEPSSHILDNLLICLQEFSLVKKGFAWRKLTLFLFSCCLW